MGTKERSEKEEVVMSRCAGVKKEQPGNGLRRGMEEPDRREEEEEAGEMERERSGRERERIRTGSACRFGFVAPTVYLPFCFFLFPIVAK